MEGLTKIKEINGFCIWEITGAEALQHLSMGTSLCTQIPEVAKAYSRDTALYMVTKPRADGLHMRVCLIHNETKQCKNMNNVDLDEFVSEILVSEGIADFLAEIAVFDTPKPPFLTGPVDQKKWNRMYRSAMIEAGVVDEDDDLTEEELFEEISNEIDNIYDDTPENERQPVIEESEEIK